MWFILILLVSPIWADLDPKMFGAEGSELLKELKESGVIDQFEKELEKMLHEQKDNEVKTEDSATPKKGN